MKQTTAFSGVVYLLGMVLAISPTGRAAEKGATSAVVDTLSDVLDGDVASMTALEVTPGADGKISLREAIIASNNTSGSDSITFSIAGTVNLLTELPELSDPAGGVFIDGAGQVVLNNASGLMTIDGLRITSGGNQIQGLTIQGFAAGVQIRGAAAIGNSVMGCTLGGKRVNETLVAPNSHGVAISAGASLNVIGATQSGIGNTISNNSIHGVVIEDGAFQNTVQRNRIGTTPDGQQAAANGLSGIVINGGSSNLIGGSGGSDGNVISGNSDSGITLLNGSTLNQIEGNTIGLSWGLDAILPNGTGILIGSLSTDNAIGSTVFAGRNLIGGNRGNGITLLNAVNTLITGNVLGSPDVSMTTFGNGGHGIYISGASTGNKIGNETGYPYSQILNNGLDGIQLDGAGTFSNPITRNEIFGNGGLGIRIVNGAQQGIAPPSVIAIELGGLAFGTAVPNSTVELFSVTASGQYFVGRFDVDAKGGFQTDFPIREYEPAVLEGTVTDSAFNTSEFSVPVAIPISFDGTPTQLVELFYNTDLDRDERLSLAEYQEATGRDAASFASADTNADGALVYEELVALAMLESENEALQVNTLADTADAPDLTSAAALLLDPGSDGKISLREALLAMNSTYGGFITFSVSGTIQPLTELPPIAASSSRIFVDGGRAIVLDGSLLSNGENGISMLGGLGHIFGLQIVHFPGAGVVISGPGAYTNHVLACQIGTDGSTAHGNKTGILITAGATASTIGGGLRSLGNVVSGNENGIVLDGSETQFNVVAANLVGVDAAGATAIPNTKNGLQLINGTLYNFIVAFGGYNAPNIISGNGDGTGDGGISISGGSSYNFILGNVIGGLVSESALAGNNPCGIRLSGAANSNFIGLDEIPVLEGKSRSEFLKGLEGITRKGLVPEDILAPNYIVGSTSDGVQIDGDGTTWNTLLYNEISNNGGKAIHLVNGANGGITLPVITLATTTAVGGTSVPGGLVQVFMDPEDEGRQFVAQAQTNPEGAWSLTLGKDKGAAALNYTATLTDAVGNTSELSAPVAVGGDPICTDPLLDSDGDGVTDCVEAAEGTDPELPDTDGDGMPDGFEIEFSLNPLSGEDAALDNDHDFLSNLEEYLGNTNPNVADNVNVTLHVDSEVGVDGPDNGSVNNPLRTIAFALNRAAGAPGTVKFVRLAPGEYAEDIGLVAGVTLSGPVDAPEVDDDVAIIAGVVAGATDTVLEDVTLLSQDGTETLLNMDSSNMIVRRVRFVGLDSNRLSTGVLAQGAAASSGLVDDCDFVDMGIGVEITGGLPVVRKSLFLDPGIAGIAVRDTADVSGDEGLSTSLDAGSGFNTFTFNPAAANPVTKPVAVLNESEVLLRMENNDWGTDDDAAVVALIQGTADFSPKLVAGSAILASTVLCTVFDSKTQARVTNGSVALEVSGFRPVTDNEAGVYAFPAVLEDAYTIIGNATGFEQASQGLSVGSGEIKSVVLPLSSLAGEGEGEGEGEKDPGASAFCGPGESGSSHGGDVALVVVLVALLLTGLGVARGAESSTRS